MVVSPQRLCPPMSRYLFLPTALATLVVNLIPLYGVLSWGWDTFQLLILYWIETVVIAFWTIRRLARLPGEQKKPNAAPFNLAEFFTLHAGMFIGVHFILLWAFFSYDWFRKVHGVGSFFFELFIANGVWVAIVCMLVLHAISYLVDAKPGHDGGAPRHLVQTSARTTGDPVMPIIGGLYVRIIITQIAILVGAWFSGFTNSLAPLVIVIVLKTLVDLGLGAYTPLKELVDSRTPAKER
jgi:hypothetical protein